LSRIGRAPVSEVWTDPPSRAIVEPTPAGRQKAGAGHIRVSALSPAGAARSAGRCSQAGFSSVSAFFFRWPLAAFLPCPPAAFLPRPPAAFVDRPPAAFVDRTSPAVSRADRLASTL